MPASIALSTVGMSPRAKASYKSLIICTLLITRLLSGPGTGRYAGSTVLGRPAIGLDPDPDPACGARVAARVVDQNAGQPVDPLGRRVDQHRDARRVRGHGRTDGPETVRADQGQHGQVDRLVTGGRRPGVEPGQPQHVLDQLAQPLGLTLDPGQHVPVSGCLPG